MNEKQARAAVKRAERAYAAGQCLVAGQQIDRSYRAIGLKPSRGLKAVATRLRRLDEKFERTCVRKHPKGR